MVSRHCLLPGIYVSSRISTIALLFPLYKTFFLPHFARSESFKLVDNLQPVRGIGVFGEETSAKFKKLSPGPHRGSL